MNQGATYTETTTYPKQVQFTLAQRTASQFRMENWPESKTLDYPNRKNILTEDRCVLTKKLIDYYNKLNGTLHLEIDDKGVVTTIGTNVIIGNLGDVVHKRYIKNCPTIWVMEQEKRGFKPTPSFGDEIWMTKGDLFIDIKNTPTDKGLYLHLMLHNQNADFEYRDSSIAEPIFKIEDNQRNAIVNIEVEDQKQEAREIIYQMRDKKRNSFDSDKIAFCTSVFPQQLGGLNSDAEKFDVLLRMAEDAPKLFIDSIGDKKVDYYSVVNMAKELQILVRDRGFYMNTITKNKVVSFRGSLSEAEVVEKLVEHYSSQDGLNEFEHLKATVEAKKMSMSS